MKKKIEVTISAEIETHGDEEPSFGEICDLIGGNVFSHHEWELSVQNDKVVGVKLVD